jgi:hypothetical protein
MAAIGADRGGPASAHRAATEEPWSRAIRVVVALALIVAALDYGDVPIPTHGRGRTEYYSDYDIWWAPIVAGFAVAALLVPQRLLAHKAARRLALVTAASLLVVGSFLLIIEPWSGWWGATWRQRGALTVTAAGGVVSALGTVLIFGRVSEKEWPGQARNALTGLGLAVCFVAFPRISVGWAVLILVAAMTVVAPGRFLRSQVGRVMAYLVVAFSLQGGSVLSFLGWAAGALCVARENVSEWFCPYAMPLIVFSAVALSAGFALTSRMDTLEG